MNRAVFLDRDGVLNQSPELGKYVLSPEELDIIPSSIRAVKIIKELGFLTVVITNQSCVGRGLLTHKQLEGIHNKLKQEMDLDHIRYCPHTPFVGCLCRKPNPDMVIEAAEYFKIDIEQSYFVGDELKDLMTAINAGCIPIKVKEPPFYTLYAFAMWLKEKERER